jgi:hypothetical protein
MKFDFYWCWPNDGLDVAAFAIDATVHFIGNREGGACSGVSMSVAASKMSLTAVLSLSTLTERRYSSVHLRGRDACNL